VKNKIKSIITFLLGFSDFPFLDCFYIINQYLFNNPLSTMLSEVYYEKAAMVDAIKTEVLERIQEQQEMNKIDPRAYRQLNVFEVLNFEEISDDEGDAQASKPREATNASELANQDQCYPSNKVVKEVRK
jgi:hypothetical protein